MPSQTPRGLAAWYAPISGDLRMNGQYGITGNASGRVTECDPPATATRYRGELGESISAVRVNLTTSEDEGRETTTLTLTHTFPVDSHWEKYGPGAGGVGWDMTLAGLALDLDGLRKPSEEDWAASKEAALFTERSSERWREAVVDGARQLSMATRIQSGQRRLLTGRRHFISQDGMLARLQASDDGGQPCPILI